MRRRLSPLAWTLLALAWALVIWWLMTLDRLPAAPLAARWLPAILDLGSDKLAHAGLFLVQAFLLARATESRLGSRRALLLAVVLCVVFGAATELRQRTIPTRDADPADLAADGIGAAAAAAALPLSRRWSRARAPVRA
ncbi:MAG TPA: VanZ family protein [Thermoanaerobaculia bacterium]|nr:VanZ family protein [Thermoanaerobaculia bacterium]